MTRLRLAVCLLTFCLAGLVECQRLRAEANWPQFRGPRGDGTSPAKDLPITWSETENIRWKTPIHGKGWSSPVVWGEQIWLTTATEDGHRRSVLCVDLASGKIVFDKLVLEMDNPQYSHPTNSYASPTPCIEEGRVYLHFGAEGTYCIDTRTCEVLWSRLDFPCNHHRGAASSPILFENLLIVAFDGYTEQYVVALDKSTGKTVWKRDRNIKYKNDNGDIKKAYGTCTIIEVDGRPLLVSPSAECTIAYEPHSGDEVWRVHHGGMNQAARPLLAGGRLILSSGAGGVKLLAVDPKGRGDITGTNILWTYGKVVPSRSSSVVVGDLLFMVNDAGIASCIDVKTTDQKWHERFGGDYAASPIYADGRIYFFSEDGRSPVIEPKSEFKLLAENKLGDCFKASPAVVGKAFILRSRTDLYRVEKP